MDKRISAAAMGLVLLLSGCGKAVPDAEVSEAFSVEEMNRKLLEVAETLPQSTSLFSRTALK